jgi:hypothetical protein
MDPNDELSGFPKTTSCNASTDRCSGHGKEYLIIGAMIDDTLDIHIKNNTDRLKAQIEVNGVEILRDLVTGKKRVKIGVEDMTEKE